METLVARFHTKTWCRITIVLAVAALFTGCRGMGTQQFTAFGPSQADELARSSRVVLDVRCTNVTVLADYNLWENMQMLAPMPKRWKIDMMLQVERVVQGEFTEHSLRIHWLREPTEEQNKVVGMAGRHDFTNGLPMRVGFDSRSDEHLRNLKLMIRNQ